MSVRGGPFSILSQFHHSRIILKCFVHMYICKYAEELCCQHNAHTPARFHLTKRVDCARTTSSTIWMNAIKHSNEGDLKENKKMQQIAVDVKLCNFHWTSKNIFSSLHFLKLLLFTLFLWFFIFFFFWIELSSVKFQWQLSMSKNCQYM